MSSSHNQVPLRRSPRLINQKPIVYFPKRPVNKCIHQRIRREMAEFDHPSYSSEFTWVHHCSDNSVTVTLINGKTYIVTRCSDFLKPPTIHDLYDLSSSPIDLSSSCAQDNYSPAYTSAKWLLMLLL